MGIGGLAGYLLGSSQLRQTETSPLFQKNALLETKISLLLEQQQGVSPDRELDIEGQLLLIDAAIAQLQPALLPDLALGFAYDDPVRYGWVRGRDGLLIASQYPNIIGEYYSVAAVQGYQDLPTGGQGVQVSSVLGTAPPRSFTIGTAVNQSLDVHIPRGVSLASAVVVAFTDAVALERDLMAKFLASGEVLDAVIAPLGTHSLLIAPLTIRGVGKTPIRYSELVVNDLVHNSPARTPETAISWRSQGHILRLSHSSSIALTVRSVHYVGNPFSPFLRSLVLSNTEESSRAAARVSTMVLFDRNDFLEPTFFRSTETALHEFVDVPSEAYML